MSPFYKKIVALLIKHTSSEGDHVKLINKINGDLEIFNLDQVTAREEDSDGGYVYAPAVASCMKLCCSV